MPTLLQVLSALNDEQTEMVRQWPRKDVSFSDHAFDGINDRVTIPFHHEEKEIEPHPDVKEHLERHGFPITDYRKGLAQDKHGRQVKIGGILNKTKAPEEVKQAFINDPSRQVSRNPMSDYRITYSRHPRDVAGMSTGQGWSSCMDMNKGNPTGVDNSKYLKDDVREGTHVAYLHHKDDEDLEHPVARIALKPFYTKSGRKYTILRPEHRAYGTGPEDGSFNKQVSEWANRHFPTHPDREYDKASTVYDDSYGNEKKIFGNNRMMKKVNGDNYGDLADVAAYGNKDHIEHMITKNPLVDDDTKHTLLSRVSSRPDAPALAKALVHHNHSLLHRRLMLEDGQKGVNHILNNVPVDDLSPRTVSSMISLAPTKEILQKLAKSSNVHHHKSIAKELEPEDTDIANELFEKGSPEVKSYLAKKFPHLGQQYKNSEEPKELLNYFKHATDDEKESIINKVMKIDPNSLEPNATRQFVHEGGHQINYSILRNLKANKNIDHGDLGKHLASELGKNASSSSRSQDQLNMLTRILHNSAEHNREVSPSRHESYRQAFQHALKHNNDIDALDHMLGQVKRGSDEHAFINRKLDQLRLNEKRKHNTGLINELSEDSTPIDRKKEIASTLLNEPREHFPSFPSRSYITDEGGDTELNRHIIDHLHAHPDSNSDVLSKLIHNYHLHKSSPHYKKLMDLLHTKRFNPRNSEEKRNASHLDQYYDSALDGYTDKDHLKSMLKSAHEDTYPRIAIRNRLKELRSQDK